jgi:hypothetical protein
VSARTRFLIVLGLLTICAALPATAQADFGFAPGSVSVTARNLDGTLDTQAGSHPASFQISFGLNEEEGKSVGGALRNVLVELPPGLVGNLASMPRCTRAKFEGATPGCPGSSQVGLVQANATGLGEVVDPVYNVEPPPGVAAELGFSVFNFVPLQFASVRSEDGYGVSVLAPNVPLELKQVTETIWGTPSEAIHDPDRTCGDVVGRGHVQGCAADVPHVPFLTLPTSCGPLEVTVKGDSDLNPGVYVSERVPMLDDAGHVANLQGCESVPFDPAVSAVPSSHSAESPSGLGFELSLPDKGLLDPSGIAESEPVKTEVTLPAGITANPAAAAGLVGCNEAQYKAATGALGVGCPEASKLGTLVARSPLLEEAIEGSVYLATPNQNKFGSLLALYVVASAKERGVLVKQAGEVEVDQATGQLTTTFDELPPLPYSSFELKLREGPRAPLITPDVCGSYETVARLYPFSSPGSATTRTAPFTVSAGAGGGACASSAAQLPFAPKLSAGTLTPLAGAFSPFVFKLSREDGDQRFSSINATLPEGLTGKLAGIPYCPESGIAQAQARSNEGEGALELSSPSCPAASQVGVVNVGAGAGSQPYHVQGEAYLAGPYKGAPLSLAIVTPAIAGPFDLGVVVVRAALYVDESTAEITVKSDPVPTILHGIPLDVRSISVQVDRSQFTLNPTDCEAMAVGGEAVSTTGAVAQLSNRFQVGGCAGLGFNPTLKLAFKGGTTRTRHPALSTVLTFPSKGAFANVASAAVTLPHSELLDQAHVGLPCTRPQFAEEKCPKISVLGRAKAWSPLLDEPLEGKVYFRANGGVRDLPDIVADLRGQVHLVLVGAVDTVTPKRNARIRTTFFQVPDAPVSKFELQLKGGHEGTLVNSENLCRSPQRAVVRLVAQNGRVKETQPTIANGCGKKGKRG